MSRSFPIWNKIQYQLRKSYGVQETGDVEVRIGTSASNSHVFVRHTTTHKQLDNGDREYRFYVDGECIRRAVLPKGKKEIQYEVLP